MSLDWRSDRHLSVVATDVKTVNDSGIISMDTLEGDFNISGVLSICREFDMYHVPNFVEAYGEGALLEFLVMVDWDTVSVDYDVLDELVDAAG